MEKEIEYEKQGLLNEHLNPIDSSMVIKVDGNFHYIKTPLQKFAYFFQMIFIVIPWIWYINHIRFRTKVIGKENLKGIKKAILTCNHIDIFDCLVVQGNTPRTVYTTAAPFNNRKGFLGQMMRVGHMMPMSEDMEGKKHFTKAIEYFLNKNKYILFYPEQSMWLHYEKPRPYKDGAFHFAYKHNVPVVPMFITMKKRKNNKYKFFLNISKPIYPNQEMNKRDNVEYLRDASYKAVVDIYEKFYNKKLTYLCDEEKVSSN